MPTSRFGQGLNLQSLDPWSIVLPLGHAPEIPLGKYFYELWSGALGSAEEVSWKNVTPMLVWWKGAFL